MKRLAAALSAVFLLTPGLPAEEAGGIPKPTPNRKDEPPAKALSAAKAGAFLDSAGVHWTRERQCGSCHTNYPALMARSVYAREGVPAPGYVEMRKFFEGRVAGWDGGKDGAKPRWDAEVVATAAVLAFTDAQTGATLHPLTRQALDRMWTLQQKDGAWNWLKCDWPPLEQDDYYGATFAALGAGIAPEGYAKSEKAAAGLARLRDYFKKTPPPNPHHKTMLLWASLRVDGLMSAGERDASVRELKALQRDDGGWNLPSLGDWKRRDQSANDRNAPSDGYATGLVVYVLRQAGVGTDDPAIRAGVNWLKANQRASGRWFTFSLNNDKAHYITHAGTAYAVLALHACDALED